MKKQKRILIVRPDRIGDVVLSTPLPREIKKQYPDSYIAVLVRKYTKDIYFNNPYVNNIILADDNKSFFQKVKEIRHEKFTHSLTLLPTERLNYMLFLAGIPYRVGVGHKLYQFLTFTHYVSRHKYIPLRHEADYCMDLARKIGVKSDNLETEIFLTAEEIIKVAEFRKKRLTDKKYIIGIHTTSGNSSPNWLVSTYKKLIERLSANRNFYLVATDNKVPKELANIPGIEYPNVGKSLRESFITLAGLDYLISSSTGPMHIAAALKVKTLSLFCPIPACSPELWGPQGNEHKIILPPKHSNKSSGDVELEREMFEVLHEITVEEVTSELEAWIMSK